jgi:hypothetical protein
VVSEDNERERKTTTRTTTTNNDAHEAFSHHPLFLAPALPPLLPVDGVLTSGSLFKVALRGEIQISTNSNLVRLVSSAFFC